MALERQNSLQLPATLIGQLREQLPDVAAQTIAAIIAEVPGYTRALDGPMGRQIASAVQLALAGFLSLAARSSGTDPSSPLRPVVDAAYALGRGEARSGRSMDALSAAYRVGARVAWRELAAVAVEADLPAGTVAQFAELVFAYIDELSAASVSGHADELAVADRTRQRYRDRLARALLDGEPLEALDQAAARAEWSPPATLTALVLPSSRSRELRPLSDARWLMLADDLPSVSPAEELMVCLIPDLSAQARIQLRAAPLGAGAVIGPTKPWTEARSSYHRALRGLVLSSASCLDTEEHLAELAVGADAEALRDLRVQVLAPLAELRPATAEKLTETLRAWLLHQGRREEVAAALFLHPQTVRYRMTQLRELFGAALLDPDTVFALTVALGPIS